MRLAPVLVALALTGGEAVAAKRNPTTTYNAGKVAVLAVDVRAARLDGPETFLPLHVAVLNKGKTDFGLTPESFVLLRPDGSRLPVASVVEVWGEREGTRADLRIGEPFLDALFARYPVPPFRWAPFDFFPATRTSGPTPRTGIELRFAEGAFGYLYFRHPGDRPLVGRYQLLVSPRGLETTFVVDFVPYDPPKQERR